jgi:Uncharacterised nucleotidyltransferase
MGDPIALASTIAGYGLGPPGTPVLECPLSDAEWYPTLELLRSQRLIGLFSAAVDDGAAKLSPRQGDELGRTVDETTRQTRNVEQLTTDMAATLHSAGIDHRVLKGPAVAHLDYPDPERRPYVLVNLLVPAGQYDEAVRMLVAAGFDRSVPEPRPGFDRRFGKGTTLSAPGGGQVDLHRTIVSGPFAMLANPDSLFDTSTKLQLQGSDLLALGTEERLLHACFDARIGDDPPLFLRLRDIVQVVLSHHLDIGRIEAISDIWRAQSVVAEAINHAWTRLGVKDIVPLSVWAAGHRSTRTDRRRLDAYRRVRGRTLVSVPTVRDIRPRRAVVPYLRAVLVPDRRYLQGRYRGHLHRWWRGTVVVVGRQHDSDGPSESGAIELAPTLDPSWCRS